MSAIAALIRPRRRTIADDYLPQRNPDSALGSKGTRPANYLVPDDGTDPAPPALRIPPPRSASTDPARAPLRLVPDAEDASYGAPPPAAVAAAPIVAVPAPVAAPIVAAPIVAAPRDHLAELEAQLDRQQNTPPPKLGRGRAFLLAALSRLAPGLQQAQANANAQGRAVTWGDVAAGAAQGLGAGVAGAISPDTVAYARQQQQIARTRGEIDHEVGRQGELAKVRAEQAKPIIEAGKVRLQATTEAARQTEKQIDNLRDTWKHLPEYKRGDPRWKDLDAEAARLGVLLPDFEKSTPPRAPVVREVDGKAFQYDENTKSWVPATGLPEEPRVNYQGFRVSPAQALQAKATGESRADAQAARAEDRAVSDQRYGESRYEADARAASEHYAKLENARTNAVAHAEAARDLFAQAEQLRARLATLSDENDPKGTERRNVQADYDKAQATAAAELREQKAAIGDMNTAAKILRSQYGSIYDVGGEKGADGMFYPSATQRPRPPLPRANRAPAPKRNGAYAGQVIPRSALGAAAQRLGVATEAEAERLIAAHGGIIIN